MLLSPVHAFEAAMKELERCRARVTAAADCFLQGTIPLDELRLESAAAAAAEKARDEALRRWREPSSHETAQREVARLSDEQRRRLQSARTFVDEQLDAAMADEGLDPMDAEDLEKAATRPSTRALRRALAALEADVCLMRW